MAPKAALEACISMHPNSGTEESSQMSAVSEEQDQYGLSATGDCRNISERVGASKADHIRPQNRVLLSEPYHFHEKQLEEETGTGKSGAGALGERPGDVLHRLAQQILTNAKGKSATCAVTKSGGGSSTQHTKLSNF